MSENYRPPMIHPGANGSEVLDIPMCVCNDFIDGHTPTCAVRKFVERLQKENERLTKLTEADGKEIGSYKDGTGLRGENAELAKEVDALRKENEELMSRYGALEILRIECDE